MLRDWTPHEQHQEQLYLKMLLHYEMQRSRLVALDKSISISVHTLFITPGGVVSDLGSELEI
jgi:hypothetical protein